MSDFLFYLRMHQHVCFLTINCFTICRRQVHLYLRDIYKFFEIFKILTFIFFLGCLTSLENGSISRFIFGTRNGSVMQRYGVFSTESHRLPSGNIV